MGKLCAIESMDLASEAKKGIDIKITAKGVKIKKSNFSLKDLLTCSTAKHNLLNRLQNNYYFLLYLRRI